MAFEKVQLQGTRFSSLVLDRAGIGQGRIPPGDARFPWMAAVDEGRNMLFTQLISNSSEMREGIYFYLLAIDNDMVLVRREWESARILPGPGNEAQKYPLSFLETLVNEAAVVVTADKKAFCFERGGQWQ